MPHQAIPTPETEEQAETYVYQLQRWRLQTVLERDD